MSDTAITAITSLISAAISAISVIIVAKINRDNAKAREEKEKTDKLLKEIRDGQNSGNRVSVASARALIAQIYDQNKSKRIIDQGLWESVSDLYDAYKATTINGHVPNSWCDSLVNEMKKWKKV